MLFKFSQTLRDPCNRFDRSIRAFQFLFYIFSNLSKIISCFRRKNDLIHN